MNLCSKEPEVLRCRPLLGTFVEITASGLDEEKLHTAINAAFSVIERIQNLMSIHDNGSEVSLLNQKAASQPVTVGRETFKVLRWADRLASESNGAFDYTVAPTLARWGLLPAKLGRKAPGSWRDVLLLRGRKVFFLQPLALDLGGIAKGFAVDAAIGILRQHNVIGAVVNAGGDLRAFGLKALMVHLRNPVNPRMFSRKINIQDSALATSSPCFTERQWHGQRVSHLVNSIGQMAVTGAISVSVRAKECWLADALTKVVLNAPQLAQKLLARYRAEAFLIGA